MKAKGLMTISKPRTAGKLPNSDGGFSLLELMIVIAMGLVIVATAAPTMMNVVSTGRMRGTMSNMSTYVQRARADAIRNNLTKSVWNVQSTGEYFIYSATGNDTAPGLTGADGMMPAGKQVVYMGTPTGANAPSTLDPATAFGSSTTPVNTGTSISFNSRGVPCLWATGACTAVNQAFVWYFVFQPPFGSNRWAALSISPAGRIKNWYWDGGAWRN